MQKPLIDFRTINFGRSPLALAAIVLLALFGTASIAYGIAADSQGLNTPQPVIVQTEPSSPNPSLKSSVDRSEPTFIQLPSLGIESNVVQVGKNPDGTVEVPLGVNHEKVGWYKYSSTPGSKGPSVFLGHYDSKTGPSIFYKLVDLKVNDPIVVKRADGSQVKFVATSIESYPKNQFPTSLVYGPTDDAQIRLITCGGEFNLATNDYEDNVVVVGKLAL